MGSPTILMYHGVDTVPAQQDPDNLFVDPEVFAEQMEALASRGYTVVGENDLVAWQRGASLPRRSIVITFDDGYRSVRTHAVPVLQQHGFPAICYVSAGLLDAGLNGKPHQAYGLMDRSEVAELAAAGVSIACHGWDHSSLRAAEPHDLVRSTATSREVLAEVTGTAPTTFAYPYGHHDDAARAAVEQAGFDLALATYDGCGRFALPRVDINATDTPKSFRIKLNKAYPTARRVTNYAPGLRRGVHHLVGFAKRTHQR